MTLGKLDVEATMAVTKQKLVSILVLNFCLQKNASVWLQRLNGNSLKGALLPIGGDSSAFSPSQALMLSNKSKHIKPPQCQKPLQRYLWS